MRTMSKEKAAAIHTANSLRMSGKGKAGSDIVNEIWTRVGSAIEATTAVFDSVATAVVALVASSTFPFLSETASFTSFTLSITLSSASLSSPLSAIRASASFQIQDTMASVATTATIA